MEAGLRAAWAGIKVVLRKIETTIKRCTKRIDLN
jgi:hypothetical protein